MMSNAIPLWSRANTDPTSKTQTQTQAQAQANTNPSSTMAATIAATAQQPKKMHEEMIPGVRMPPIPPNPNTPNVLSAMAKQAGAGTPRSAAINTRNPSGSMGVSGKRPPSRSGSGSTTYTDDLNAIGNGALPPTSPTTLLSPKRPPINPNTYNPNSNANSNYASGPKRASMSSSEFGNIIRVATLPIKVGGVGQEEMMVNSSKDMVNSISLADDDEGEANAGNAGTESKDLRQSFSNMLRRSRTLSRGRSSSGASHDASGDSDDASTLTSSAPGAAGAGGQAALTTKTSNKRFMRFVTSTGLSPKVSAGSLDQQAGVASPLSPSSSREQLKRHSSAQSWDDQVQTVHFRVALSQRTSKIQLDMNRQPPLSMALYQKQWGLDPWALPHNAIRQELMDCYSMISYMDYRREDLGPRDYEMFFAWWRLFGLFYMRYMECEEEVMFPWVEAKVKLAGLLVEGKRKKIKDHLRYVLLLVVRFEKRIRSGEFDCEPLYIIKRAVDKVALLSQEYFNYEERTLPRLAHAKFSEKEKKELDKSIISFYLKGSNAAADIIILSRWLQKDHRDPKQLLEWRYDNLGAMTWTKYGVWTKTIDAKHLQFPAYFKAKREIYKTDQRQREILRKENPDAYFKKYGRYDAAVTRMRSKIAQENTSNNAVVSSMRDEALEAQLGGRNEQGEKSPSSMFTTAEIAEQVYSPRFANHTKAISPTSSSLPPISPRAEDLEVESGTEVKESSGSKDDMDPGENYMVTSAGQKEFDQLKMQAAKLQDYLSKLDKKYGSGVKESYGLDDDSASVHSSAYAPSVRLHEEANYVDALAENYDKSDVISSYSVSLYGGGDDSKTMMEDVDIDLDQLSLADDNESEYDVGALELEEYLAFDDAINMR